MEVKPGYKRTDVGIIPEEWDVVRLGRYSEITKLAGFEYSNHFNSYKDGGDIVVIRGTNITHNSLDLSDVKTIPKSTSDRLPRSKLKAGDLVFAYVGTIGPVFLIDRDNVYHLGPNTARITCKDGLFPRFLFCYFLSDLVRKEISERISTGAQPSLSMTKIRTFRILKPTKAEQEAIAEALHDADGLIESLEQLLTKKRQLKQGAMQELLTGKKRLPGFTGEWQVRRLGDVTDTDPENLGSDTRQSFTFNYIALEDVDMGTLSSYSEQVFRTAPSRARRKLRKGDVLVSTVRPNLMSHLLFSADGDNWVCSTGFCVVRCRNGVSHPGYVYFHMFAGYVARQIEALLTGSNYPAINGGDVRGLQIPFPEYEEQTAIAAILSDMDAEIAALDAKLAKVRSIKQGMMQELLTGRIRLV